MRFMITFEVFTTFDTFLFQINLTIKKLNSRISKVDELN